MQPFQASPNRSFFNRFWLWLPSHNQSTSLCQDSQAALTPLTSGAAAAQAEFPQWFIHVWPLKQRTRLRNGPREGAWGEAH